MKTNKLIAVVTFISSLCFFFLVAQSASAQGFRKKPAPTAAPTAPAPTAPAPTGSAAKPGPAKPGPGGPQGGASAVQFCAKEGINVPKAQWSKERCAEEGNGGSDESDESSGSSSPSTVGGIIHWVISLLSLGLGALVLILHLRYRAKMEKRLQEASEQYQEASEQCQALDAAVKKLGRMQVRLRENFEAMMRGGGQPPPPQFPPFTGA